METNYKHLISYIDLIMNLKGLTAKQLGEKAGVSPQKLYNLRFGRNKKFDGETCYRIFKALEVTDADFYRFIYFLEANTKITPPGRTGKN